MAVYTLIRLFIILIVSRFIKVEAVSAVKGSTVQLKCPHIASGGKRISWSKIVDGVALRYTEGTIINPTLQVKSRLNVTGDQKAEKYHLSISDVRKSDEGTYMCQLSGTSNSTTLQLSVFTNIPTSVNIENVGLDKKLNGIEGRNLIIRCSAVGGDPAPDVKLLISESVVTVAKSSVQYTLSSVNRSYDGQNVTCFAGFEKIPFYLLNNSARIYLKLKPYPPIFNSDSVNTEETRPLIISCTSTSSRPMASIYWLLGDGKTNITTNATQSSHTHDSTTDTYSVTSTLNYIIGRVHNGKILICGASNEVTSKNGGVVETSKTINVKYAPDITVNSSIYTQNDVDRIVTCDPHGNPDIYIYHKWQHKSRHGDLIREFDGDKTLKLPDVPRLLKYQDSGEYVCTASNGIKDKDDKFEQTGSGYVTVNAKPVFTSDTNERVNQFGEIDKEVDIHVNVYSFPKFTSFEWTRNSKPITTQNAVKYKASSTPTIVKDKIHGKEVQLDGYNVTLTICDLTAGDLTIYTVTLTNGFGNTIYPIILQSSSLPETPGNFSKRESSATSLTVQWDPNSGGGYTQTFYMQYRVKGLLQWTTALVGWEDINDSKRRRTYELTNLQEGKAYELRMYAENIAMKRSNFTELLIVFTESSVSTTSSAVIGALVGVVVTLVIVLASFIVILLFKRNQGKSQNEKNDKYYKNAGFQDIKKGDENEEVENKFDVDHQQSSNTYETLGTKDSIDVYDDLENPEGLTSPNPSFDHYEALGVQD